MQCRDNRDATVGGHRRQIEGEIEQAVDVDDVWFDRAQDVADSIGHDRRPVCLRKRRAGPVVHDFGNRQPVENTPRQVPMRAQTVVYRRKAP